MHVVICGGGIIGCSCAYYLGLRGIKCTIVERNAIGKAESIKTSGFLARNWGNKEMKEIQKISFDILTKLCKKWKISSYREIPTFYVQGARSQNQKGQFTNKVSYLDNYVRRCDLMDSDTAQILPDELKNKFLKEATFLGCEIKIGNVKNIIIDENDFVKSVLIDKKYLICDHVVITMGSWSVKAGDWFPNLKLPMSGILSTSIIFKTRLNAKASLFCEEDDYGCHLEIYPRENGDIYISGCGGSKHLQASEIIDLKSNEITADLSRVQAAIESLRNMSSIANTKFYNTQACLHSYTIDGKPIIGLIPGTKNAFIATGHNCWSILWSSITGRSISELIADGRTSLNLELFNPNRFI